MLPSKEGARRVREVLGIKDGERKTMVVVGRRGGRGWKEEAKEVEAMRDLCRAVGLEFYYWRGDEGMRKAVEVFGGALVVVGFHGGGLANIVFAGEGTTVIEVGLEEMEFEMYGYLAEALGMKYERWTVSGGSLFEAKVEMGEGWRSWVKGVVEGAVVGRRQ